MRRLLDVDPLSGLKTFHDFDAATETTIISYEQDAQPLLDLCKEESNHADRKLGDGLVHAARVLPGVQLEWLTKYGVRMWDPNHRQAVHDLLDGEYRHLKRLPITLGRAR